MFDIYPHLYIFIYISIYLSPGPVLISIYRKYSLMEILPIFCLEYIVWMRVQYILYVVYARVTVNLLYTIQVLLKHTKIQQIANYILTKKNLENPSLNIVRCWRDDKRRFFNKNVHHQFIIRTINSVFRSLLLLYVAFVVEQSGRSKYDHFKDTLLENIFKQL